MNVDGYVLETVINGEPMWATRTVNKELALTKDSKSAVIYTDSKTGFTDRKNIIAKFNGKIVVDFVFIN